MKQTGDYKTAVILGSISIIFTLNFWVAILTPLYSDFNWFYTVKAGLFSLLIAMMLAVVGAAFRLRNALSILALTMSFITAGITVWLLESFYLPF